MRVDSIKDSVKAALDCMGNITKKLDLARLEYKDNILSTARNTAVVNTRG